MSHSSLTGSSSASEQVFERIGSILLQIHQFRELDRLLNYGVRAVRDLLSADRVLIYQLLPGGDGVVIAESVGDEWKSIAGELIHDPCLQERWIEPYRQGRVSVIEDLQSSGIAPCHIDLLTHIQVKANLVAPVMVQQIDQGPGESNQQLWGLLIVHQCRTPRKWPNLYIQALKQIAAQIGIALHHLEVQNQLQQHLSSEDRWRSVLEGVEDGVWDWNLETGKIFYSYQWKAMFGYEDDEVGNTLSDWDSRVHPEDLAASYADLERHFKGETPFYRNEHRVRTKAGIWKWSLDRGKVIQRSADGRPLRMVGTNTDISDLKAAEALLEEKESFLRSIYDGADVSIFVVDVLPNGSFCYVGLNPAHSRLTGLTNEDMQGKSPAQIFPPEVATHVEAHYQSCVEAGHPIDYEECLPFRGETTWWLTKLTPIQNAEGRVVRLIGTGLDVSALKQAQLQLHLQSAALTACADAIVITDHHGIIEWVNPAFVGLTGYEPSEAIGKTPGELVKSGKHDANFYRHLWRQILSGQVWRGELINRRKDGSLYSEEMTITPICDNDSKVCHFVAIKQDITERKYLEALLRQEFQRERLVYTINHHIRKSLDLDTILQTAVQEMRQFLDTDRVIVYQLNPDWSGVVVAESVVAGWQAILERKITDSYFVETQGRSYLDNHFNATSDVYTAGLSPCHVEMMRELQVRAKLVLPILQEDHLWGLLVAHHCQGPRQWQPSEIRLLQELTGQLAIAIQHADLHQRLQQANQALERLSTTDSLTQVANRRRFDEALAQMWQQAHRQQQPISLVLCDIDYFKQYNDTYGHPGGDACLVAVAQALRQCLKRPLDCLARYGGEEFAVILPDTDLQGAIEVVRTMQAAIADLKIEHSLHPSSQHVTVSFGIASTNPASDPLHHPQTLLDQADQALYQAKAAGRNRYGVA
jgi:diguanylate cyclase (GGDEF)-like protein/PAS domain S-box-containing protein